MAALSAALYAFFRSSLINTKSWFFSMVVCITNNNFDKPSFVPTATCKPLYVAPMAMASLLATEANTALFHVSPIPMGRTSGASSSVAASDLTMAMMFTAEMTLMYQSGSSAFINFSANHACNFIAFFAFGVLEFRFAMLLQCELGTPSGPTPLFFNLLKVFLSFFIFTVILSYGAPLSSGVPSGSVMYPGRSTFLLGNFPINWSVILLSPMFPNPLFLLDSACLASPI